MIDSLEAVGYLWDDARSCAKSCEPAISAEVTFCKCSLANPVDFTPNATSQMAIKVHVAMQDANNIYTRAGHVKKQNMRSGGIFFVAGADFVAGAAQPGSAAMALMAVSSWRT